MVHVLASFAFTLIALATAGFILLTLSQARDAILVALGVAQTPPLQVRQRRTPIRIRERQVQPPARATARPRAAA